MLYAVILSLIGWSAYRLKQRLFPSVRWLNQQQLETIIEEAGKRHFIDPNLIKAVIWRESAFKQNARGAAGEIGLMQIMPQAAAQDWANAHGVKRPCDGILFDPKLNIDIGAWYLSRALHYWKSQGFKNYERLALCEYNAGRKQLKSWKTLDQADSDSFSWIKLTSTRKYVKSIMNKYFEYNSKKEAR